MKLRSQYFIYLTAALLAAVTFLRLHAYLDPSGGDGYFYLKQTQWLAQHFAFYHADYSFVFIPLALLTKIGLSVLTAYQIVSCFSYFMILSCIGFFTFKNLDSFPKYKFIVTLLLLIAFSFQTPLLRLCFEFIKNGFAISFFLLASVLFYKKYYKWALAFGILAALTHKTVALIFILSLGILILSLPRISKKLLALGAITVAVGIALNPRLLKHLLNFIQQIRVENLNSLFGINSHLNSVHMICLLMWLIILLSQIKKFKLENNYQKSFLSALLFFSIVPLIPMFGGANAEIKWRLMIFSFCFSFILYVFALAKIRNLKIVITTFVLSLALMSYEFSYQSGYPWIILASREVPDIQRLNEFVKPTDELITHHGMQFYIDYQTPIRAKSLIDPDHVPLYQVAYLPEFFLRNDAVKDSVYQRMLVQLGPNYGLFYYEDFKEIVIEFPYLSHWKNIYKIRPNFVQNY
ncbi:MAG: EpsG family protein [Bdellovibrio sp.]|nr:EpsG family protein [Bdellovibrio sp.]